MKKTLLYLWLFCSIAILPITASAQEAEAPAAAVETSAVSEKTGLPVPRFVTLKSGEVNLRTGPSVRYPIVWVYSKASYPMEVVAEFENWRKIRDRDGEEGWVHQSLISSQQRSAIITGDKLQYLYYDPDTNSLPIARLEPGLVVPIRECDVYWCRVRASEYTGWLPKDKLWGVYEDEVVK